MAVGLKASAFLECGATSLLLQCCCRAACVTTPPSTPLRGRGHTSSDKPTAANEKSSDRRCGVRSGCKYVVNPSRYPPHVLAAKLSRGSPAKRKKKIRDFPKRAPSPPAHHSLPLLSSLSLLCQRASHLSLPLSPVPHTLTLSALPPLTDVWLSPPLLETTFTFSPPSPLPPSPPQPNQSPRDSRPSPAQMAFVLLKLREEIPAFFDGHHSLNLYAADMVFKNSLGSNSWTLQGSTAYSALLTVWRVGVRTCFSQPQLDLLKISKAAESGKVEARWRARGRPRAPWNTRERIIVEAFSTFHVRADGNIAIHKVDKVMPGGKEPNRVMSWLARVGVALIPSPLSPRSGSPEPHATSYLITHSTEPNMLALST